MAQSKAKRPPSGKTKLVTLHLNGRSVTPGMTAFLSHVTAAVAMRSQSDLERQSPGEPEFFVNAAGELAIYVNQWSV